MWTPKGRTLEVIVRFQRGAYKATGGRLLPRANGHRVLLLDTVGRRSGKTRTVPLPYFPDDDRMIVVASNSAQGWHPAWFLNLSDRPRVEVQVGRHRSPAVASHLEGTDAEHVWARLEREAPYYLDYRAGTDREIPLVAITPDRPVAHSTPISVEHPAPGWWISILTGMGLLGLVAHNRAVWRWWSRRITSAVPRPVYQAVFWVAVGLHVGEGAAAVVIAERRGRSTSSLRWGFQTLLLGFPSLRLLRRAVRDA
ncbi:MAG: nitroreductase/quinone reductase family protein [Acidimicrobiia bacterium]